MPLHGSPPQMCAEMHVACGRAVQLGVVHVGLDYVLGY